MPVADPLVSCHYISSAHCEIWFGLVTEQLILRALVGSSNHYRAEVAMKKSTAAAEAKVPSSRKIPSKIHFVAFADQLDVNPSFEVERP